MLSFDDAHAALLRNEDLQFDFASATVTPEPRMSWTFDLVRLLHGPAALVVVGVVLAVVLAVLARGWWLRRPVRQAEGASAPPVAETLVPVAAARSALAEADALANEGRFGDAAHALLACGVTAIGRRFPTAIRPATTSRDLTADRSLPAGIRKAFGPIAAAVENAVFAGRPLGSADYALCRQVFVASALADLA